MIDREHSPTDTRDQAMQIKEAWANIDPTVAYGGMTVAQLEEALTKLDAAAATIAQLEDRLANARTQHREQRRVLWEMIKRARNGAKAQHGDDSYEYERFGGTRLSDRIRRRSTKPTPQM